MVPVTTRQKKKIRNLSTMLSTKDQKKIIRRVSNGRVSNIDRLTRCEAFKLLRGLAIKQRENADRTEPSPQNKTVVSAHCSTVIVAYDSG